MNPGAELLFGLAILLGLFGVVVPVLPGAWLVLATILFWALELQTQTGWVVLAIAATAVVASQVIKYAWPERRLRSSGVARSSIVLGGVLAVVGFFVVPVIGLVLGLVLGIYLAERQRLRDPVIARRSTRAALGAVGLAILVELSGALVAAAAWLLAVLFV